MKIRYLIWAGALVGVACLILTAIAILPESPGVTKANYHRIEVGMHMTDVEEIFAGPGEY